MRDTSFSPLHIVPEGRDMLACSCLIPEGWVQPPLPAEEHDFTNATAFLPLVLSMAPYGAVVFTIAARPAFDDGSVQDWAEFLAAHNNLVIERLQEARINRMPCVLCDATMPTDAGLMRSRSVFLEDGGRLFNIGALAPEAIWPSVEATFHALLGAFRLDEVQGLTRPPLREMTSAPSIDLSAPFHTTTSASTVPEADVRDTADDEAELGMHAATDDIADFAMAFAMAADTHERATQAADVALADDARSLDQEHPMNVRLRDSGAGLVPRVIMLAMREKFATVGAGAIEAMFRVPFGWHVIDDGKRTLVFDAGGKMQINFDLRRATPDQHIALLTHVGDEIAATQPDAQFLKLELTGLPCLGVRNLVVKGEALEQAFLVRESSRPDMALVCRVSADAEHMSMAMNTAEVILTSLQGPAPVDAEFAGQPAWWREAVLLERQDRVTDAEAVILAALDHNGVYSSLAHLHELRCARFADAGMTAAANDARKRATHWLQMYAGSATSGGEGAALSRERDARIAALGTEDARA